jgi:hypothetical protein
MRNVPDLLVSAGGVSVPFPGVSTAYRSSLSVLYSPSAAAGARGDFYLPLLGRYAVHCLATEITPFLRSQKWEFGGVHHQRPVRPCLLLCPFFRVLLLRHEKLLGTSTKVFLLPRLLHDHPDHNKTPKASRRSCVPQK